MKAKEAAEIALTAGEILLCSGSEIYRVEDTIIRICNTYQVACEAFVTPTGMFVTARSMGNHNDTASLIKRITKRTIDLHTIELINSFSRNLETRPLNYQEAMKALQGIKELPSFSLIKRLASAAMTAFVYVLLFRGTAVDALVAAAISCMVYQLKEIINKAGLSQFFEYLAAGLLAGGASITVTHLIKGLHMNEIIIGAIMILVPGLAITSGLRDALNGDILSSIARLGEALFVVVAVGVGVGFSIAMGLNWM